MGEIADYVEWLPIKDYANGIVLGNRFFPWVHKFLNASSTLAPNVGNQMYLRSCKYSGVKLGGNGGYYTVYVTGPGIPVMSHYFENEVLNYNFQGTVEHMDYLLKPDCGFGTTQAGDFYQPRCYLQFAEIPIQVVQENLNKPLDDVDKKTCDIWNWLIGRC
jgi:hypothetical protein